MRRVIVVGVLVLSACAPSTQAIQTAIAGTQAVWTPTPQGTATNRPCTDKGWQDIATYLDVAIEVRSLETLQNMKTKISEVPIDACTEEARQILLTALAREIDSQTLPSGNGGGFDPTILRFYAERKAREQTETDIVAAKLALSRLGIKLKYP